jgi:co-chaperonin GroES (HSP10)
MGSVSGMEEPVSASLRPVRDRILVERLSGHGKEQTLASGIIVPATCEAGMATRGDYFRARIDALGPEAEQIFGDTLKPGDEVLVYTYAGDSSGNAKGMSAVFTGRKCGEGLIIGPDDIICAVEGS